MNEKLKQEIDTWLKNGNITDTCFGEYDDEDIEITAEHFYNLALEEVRKELKRVEIETPVLTEGTAAYPAGRIVGRTEVREDILNFIDNLMK